MPPLGSALGAEKMSVDLIRCGGAPPHGIAPSLPVSPEDRENQMHRGLEILETRKGTLAKIGANSLCSGLCESGHRVLA
jgi:hypothetical protein